MNYVKTMGVFLLGATMGVASCLLALTFFSYPQGYTEFISKYQTLISALGALIAGWLAWHSVIEQTQVQSKAEEFRIDQEEAAARAVLVFLLDEVFKYTKECADYIKARHISCGDENWFNDQAQHKFTDHGPKLPSTLLDRIFPLIKNIAGEVQKSVSELVQTLQINNARITAFDLSIREDGLTELRLAELPTHIYDIIEIRTRAGWLFSFARSGEKQAFLLTAEILQESKDALSFGLTIEGEDIETAVAARIQNAKSMLQI